MIETVKDDITRLDVDAVVNAANKSLLGGGGVDGAIHTAAGPELLEECRGLGGADTGEARITGGYNLPADYVIHAVGPVYRDGESGEAELLRAAHINSLKLAAGKKLESVAFPAISCGVYGYPVEKAAAVAVAAVSEFLEDNSHPQKVIFCLFSDDDYRIFTAASVEYSRG